MTESETPTVSKNVGENLTGHIQDYIETYLKLNAISATQKITEAATVSFTAILISFFGMIIMIFLGFGLANWFSEFMTEKEAYFLVSFIYSAVACIVLVLRKRFIFPFLRNQIVSKIYENKH